jgi:hypothetical protein
MLGVIFILFSRLDTLTGKRLDTIMIRLFLFSGSELNNLNTSSFYELILTQTGLSVKTPVGSNTSFNFLTVILKVIFNAGKQSNKENNRSITKDSEVRLHGCFDGDSLLNYCDYFLRRYINRA